MRRQAAQTIVRSVRLSEAYVDRIRQLATKKSITTVYDWRTRIEAWLLCLPKLVRTASLSGTQTQFAQ